MWLRVHITLFSNVFKLSLKDPVLYWLGCSEAVQRLHQLQGTRYLVDTCQSGIPTGQVFKPSFPNRTNEQVFDTHHWHIPSSGEGEGPKRPKNKYKFYTAPILQILQGSNFSRKCLWFYKSCFSTTHILLAYGDRGENIDPGKRN